MLNFSFDEFVSSGLELPYTGETLKVIGLMQSKVKSGQQILNLTIYVVSGAGPPLLGRNWLDSLKLDWATIFQRVHKVSDTKSLNSLQSILNQHEQIFKAELGTLKGTKANIHVDKAVPPKYCKARTVPYAVRQKVEEELMRLENAGIIEPVPYAEWAAPIVPVFETGWIIAHMR